MHTSTSKTPRRFLTQLSTLATAAVLGITAFVLIAPATPAQAHDQLLSTQIESSESGEATGLKLSFSDNVLEVGTEIVVTDEAGTSVLGGSPKYAGRDVVQPLDAPLADGRYTAVWRVVSGDGHPIEGGFAFEIADGVAGEILPLEASDTDASGTDAPPAKDDAAADDAASAAPGDVAPPSFATFAPYLGVGAALAAMLVIGGVIVRARKNAASRNTSQNSPDKE